jgi:alpha-beta hydrolase superfamily lysophospholipase
MRTTLGMTAIGAIALLTACAQQTVSPPQAPEPAEAAPQARACPEGLPSTTQCLGGRDSAGAFYLIAMPTDWNGHLVVHAHGGPFLGDPTAKRIEDDLKRWSIVPRAGYAWAGSSFRQGGVAVRAAAQDTERVRKIFVQHVAKPKLTVLHGQSWGANVAAKGAEMYGSEMHSTGKPYDGVLLTSGVLAGGPRAYDFRLDLRVLYQYLCHNHPRPDEPAYPLWMGLPDGSTMTPQDLAQRTEECLGLRKPAASRTPEQTQKIKTLVDVLRLPESSIQGHLNWATFHFRDIARRSGGSVFGNIDAKYSGSADDAALNAGVLRYATDPEALARFAEDTDLGGRIAVPVLTVHAIDDPIAFVEMQHRFAATMAAAGHAGGLVQTFSADNVHSYISDASYVALLEAMRQWLQAGTPPTPASVAEGCVAAQARFPSSCRFQPGYRPAPLESRVTARKRP